MSIMSDKIEKKHAELLKRLGTRTISQIFAERKAEAEGATRADSCAPLAPRSASRIQPPSAAKQSAVARLLEERMRRQNQSLASVNIPRNNRPRGK